MCVLAAQSCIRSYPILLSGVGSSSDTNFRARPTTSVVILFVVTMVWSGGDLTAHSHFVEFNVKVEYNQCSLSSTRYLIIM